MYYRIKENIALRSWMFVPGAYYVKNELPAISLSPEEMDIMLMCDGEHDIEDSALLQDLLSRGLIESCERGQHPSEWSAYKKYPHRHFPKMNFMITGKCNCNCLHCFNAADNAPLMSEWDYEDALTLLDQAADCGVMGFTITGGEPMIHPHFMDIIRAIYERNMFVEEINTNGHAITQEGLDELRSFGCDAEIKISYDGIDGWHNWIRNNQTAEKKAIDAIKLCLENDFRVMVQTNVHPKNLDVILPTVMFLNELGVEKLRLIRTEEVPRWVKSAGSDGVVSIEGYYEEMAKLSRQVYDAIRALPERDRHLEYMIVWQYLNVDIKNGSYNMYPVRYAPGEYRDTYPVCSGNRGMIAVASNGGLYPCMQLKGVMDSRNDGRGNLHEKPLVEFLKGSDYLDTVCRNLYQLRQDIDKCDKCKFFEYCCGGCRAMAYMFSDEVGTFSSVDPSKCRFFNDGWYQYVERTMGDMVNEKPLPKELFS